MLFYIRLGILLLIFMTDFTSSIQLKKNRVLHSYSKINPTIFFVFFHIVISSYNLFFFCSSLEYFSRKIFYYYRILKRVALEYKINVNRNTVSHHGSRNPCYYTSIMLYRYRHLVVYL